MEPPPLLLRLLLPLASLSCLLLARSSAGRCVLGFVFAAQSGWPHLSGASRAAASVDPALRANPSPAAHVVAPRRRAGARRGTAGSHGGFEDGQREGSLDVVDKRVADARILAGAVLAGAATPRERPRWRRGHAPRAALVAA
ncbi:hypothetical protein SETIT_5G136700v2 [Setaria italica]|uniref:Uncharacterized protein n=1 Tax=Setaria italica TaxID=4555 RepID=A0A368R4E4_SETIT|nr:hypothetical protein SETIT_5G136700v2 [Setaria italica]